MNFWVISTHYQRAEYSALPTLYMTPFQAETAMLAMPPSPGGYTRSVRPATWREREERMFSNGMYERPVWSEERFWRLHAHRMADHFTHTSFASPDMIAFTEDETKGEADRQTLMKPGKYLQKFMGAGPDGTIEAGPMEGCSPVVTKQQIAFYAAWHKAGKRPVTDDVLAFAEDEDEMVRVYEAGPESCMSGTKFSGASHPIRVYAAGDLKMAYLTSTSGDVVARALCWPVKEVFGRVYPTPNSPETRGMYDEMMARLKALGWQSIEENSSVFEGAKLKHIECYGEPIMPYLDHSYGVSEHYEGGEQFWRMTHSEHHQENTDGTYRPHEDDEDDESRWTCDCCDDSYGEYESTHAVYGRWRHNPSNPRRGRGYPTDERTWCQSCVENNGWYCDGTNEHYTDSADRIDAADGCTYEANWFRANGGWECRWSFEWYMKEDDPPVVLGTGELVHEDQLEGNAFQCFETGVWWPLDYASDAVPGYMVEYDDEDEHPVEYENVLPEPPEDMEAWALAHVVPALPPPVDPTMIEVHPALILTYNAEIGSWADTLREHLDAASMATFPTPQSWALVHNHVS